MKLYYFNSDIDLEKRFECDGEYDGFPDWNISVTGANIGRYPL